MLTSRRRHDVPRRHVTAADLAGWIDATFGEEPTRNRRVQAAAWALTRSERTVWHWLAGGTIPQIAVDKIHAEWTEPVAS